MTKQKKEPMVYRLAGSDRPSDIDRRVGFLTALYEKAVEKETDLHGVNQRHLNCALLTCGGLLALAWRWPKGLYPAVLAGALLALALVFCVLDRRLTNSPSGSPPTPGRRIELSPCRI